MNLIKNQTCIRIVKEGEICDYCGRAFQVGESVFRLTDPVSEDEIYYCMDRSACTARERSQYG
jgi:hypothetical protein